MKDTPFPIEVYAEDTDYGGIVYHANYVKYLERARSNLLRNNNLGIDKLAKEGVYFAIRHVAIDYLRPARLQDRLEVTTKISKIGRTCLTFSQDIYLVDTDKTHICHGEVLVVIINQQLKPIPIPKALVEVIQNDS